MLRCFAVLIFAGVLIGLPILTAQVPHAAAQMAPPPHDDFGAAIPVKVLPFVDKERDVRGATWSEPDPDYVSCGAPIDQTVWYDVTPANDSRVTVDTFNSTYVTVVAVYTGERAGLTEVACSRNPYQARVSFDAAAGTTYHVMIAAFWDASTFCRESSLTASFATCAS